MAEAGPDRPRALLAALRARDADALRGLPVPTSHAPEDFGEVRVALPDWARGCTPDGCGTLSVHADCVTGDGTWSCVDWWRALWQFVTCAAEVRVEQRRGPVHSYAASLPATIAWQWQHAWGNRILAFLRLWVADRRGTSVDASPGGPPARLYLSHDVDYVRKTLPLRLKQSAFCIVNAVRALPDGRRCAAELARALRFLAMPADYDQFRTIHAAEDTLGARSYWQLYARPPGARSAVEYLLDPGYRIDDPALVHTLRALHADGHRIGLHPSFHAWRHATDLATQKAMLEAALESPARHCRQHWLRFGFADTWRAQEQAGFELDLTLGFNDRAGFRRGSAWRLPAWIAGEHRFSTTLDSVPLVLMDSHLFDYGMLAPAEWQHGIDALLDEIAAVGGEASVVWHQRVFHADYGWGEAYRYLLDGMRRRGIEAYCGP